VQNLFCKMIGTRWPINYSTP